MSQKRTTTYTCDKCDKDVAKRGDLRRFRLSITGPRWVDGVSFDLCEPCESALISLMADYVPDGEDPNELAR